MATLNATPASVDVAGYAGDTLTIAVTAPTSFIDGRVWTAQVRSTGDSTLVDASFTVTPPTVTDGPAYLTLAAADTAALVGAAVTRDMVGRTVTGGTYKGVWDVQLSPAGGGDPVTTLVRGALTITGDVTRLLP